MQKQFFPPEKIQGHVGAVHQQYSFLNETPGTGSDLQNPAHRPMFQALNKDLHNKFNEVSEKLVKTKKQIRYNSISGTGTAFPVQSTGSDFTPHYHKISAMYHNSNKIWIAVGIIGLIFIITMR